MLTSWNLKMMVSKGISLFAWVPFSGSMSNFGRVWRKTAWKISQLRVVHTWWCWWLSSLVHWNRDPKSNPTSLANCHWQHAAGVFNHDGSTKWKTYRRNRANHYQMKNIKCKVIDATYLLTVPKMNQVTTTLWLFTIPWPPNSSSWTKTIQSK